ncbi:hypothetical protein SAMN05421770_101829 [Granulicella rosea]|uniref:Uncharacterized protein n=1 Tax=Granulicella rosea TaxID=474952 RepID=A0A239E6G5_9BACT|nr:hypothetical protein SAMN05421770_101829 [Granulicella rosea]
MHAEIEASNDGSVAMRLDGEAAQAVLASVMFASRFHKAILPIARSMESWLQGDNGEKKRMLRCQ